MSATFCTVCGAKIEEGQSFCTQCGARVEQSEMLNTIEVEDQTNQEKDCPNCSEPEPVVQPINIQSQSSCDPNQPPMPGSIYEPVSTGGFFGTVLLLKIPLVGLIYCIVCAFGGCRKVNMRNFCRAHLIWKLIGIAVVVLIFVLFYLLILSAGGSMDEILEGIMRSV